MSTVKPKREKDGEFRRARASDEMKCLGCGWSGCVPLQREAVAWGLTDGR